MLILPIAASAAFVELAEFVRDLDPADWEQWLQALPDTEGPVALPKFQLEYDETLNDALQSLGMSDAFDWELAVSPDSPPADAYINKVRQKTIDEVGTEAAATTSVGVGVTSAPIGFTVDRPFLLAIRERLSGTILFLDAINESAVACPAHLKKSVRRLKCSSAMWCVVRSLRRSPAAAPAASTLAVTPPMAAPGFAILFK